MSLQSPADTAGLTVGPDPDRDPPISRDDLADLVKATAVEEMDRYVSAGTAWVEKRCGPIEPCQWVYRVVQGRDGSLLPPSGPIASVDALLNPAGVDVVSGLSPTLVTWATGKIIAPCYAGEWLVQVTTTRIPDDVATLKEAATVIAKHLWTIRRGPMGQQAATIHEQSVNAVVGFGYAIPDRARQLVGDLLVGGFA
jgi:hypothetical protein